MKQALYILMLFLVGIYFFIAPQSVYGTAGDNKVKSKTASIYSDEKTKGKQRTYRVKKHDTLFRVSKKFNISVTQLCDMNHISDKGQLQAGSLLKVPSLSKQECPSQKTKKSNEEPESAKMKFIWPVNDIITFSNENMNGVKSIGITITGKSGSPVISSAEGVVRRVGHMRGYGNYIVITHKNRFATVYANLNSILVNEGDHIDSGKVIGKMGKSNKNLHFQIDYEGKPTNPLVHLPKRT